jgi:SAM-dependent methyltransferase
VPPIARDDYVLGTDGDEVARLGLQHRVWRSRMLEAFVRAGISAGSRVIDVGAGPGHATMDLAELVGPSGEVLAVERSAAFLAHVSDAAARRGFANIRTRRADLGVDALDASGFDAAWCRWVACLVPSPAMLVESLAASLRPGGVAVFHEYANYAAWRLVPSRPSFDAFVAEVIASWRASGGEPDVAVALPSLLAAAGFSLRRARPLVFAVRPGDFAWQWPATFLKSGARRLRDLGRVDDAWLAEVLREFDAAERDGSTIMITPLVLELIATRRAE